MLRYHIIVVFLSRYTNHKYDQQVHKHETNFTPKRNNSEFRYYTTNQRKITYRNNIVKRKKENDKEFSKNLIQTSNLIPPYIVLQLPCVICFCIIVVSTCIHMKRWKSFKIFLLYISRVQNLETCYKVKIYFKYINYVNSKIFFQILRYILDYTF